MHALTFKNTLLRAFDSEVIRRLHLLPVELPVGRQIESPSEPITHLVFVESGMVSMTNTFVDGSQVEVGMFGYESVIGVSALMGSKRSLNRVYTQIAGNGYRCGVAESKAEFELGEIFQKLCLRYVQAQLLQAMQSTGCNAKHNLEQRLSRWLLLCADRAHADHFKMSQEFLADMLGSTRPTVSVVAGQLKAEKLIDYTRGEMVILDKVGLGTRSCECYEIIRHHLDTYAEFDTGITE